MDHFLWTSVEGTQASTFEHTVKAHRCVELMLPFLTRPMFWQTTTQVAPTMRNIAYQNIKTRESSNLSTIRNHAHQLFSSLAASSHSCWSIDGRERQATIPTRSSYSNGMTRERKIVRVSYSR